MILETILLAASGLYVTEYALLAYGRHRSARLQRRAVDAPPLTVSVIVAARDEEMTIGDCLIALLNQDYDPSKLQIIVVDDESSDRTQELVKSFAIRHPLRVTLVEATHEASDLRGKARAIAQGVDHATGDLLMFTDADCQPPPKWVSTIARYFNDDVDGCGSFTLVKADNRFSRVQHLDWTHLHALGSGAAGWGLMIGVIGNNMALRRSAYDAVGGYRGIPFSVTEDFALFVAVDRDGGGLIFPCDRDAAMWTLPCASLADVLHQKQRWARGGAAKFFPGGIVLIIAILMLGTVCIAPFVSPEMWIAVWTAKFAADILLLVPTMLRLGTARLLSGFVLFEFYFLAQAILVPLLLARRTVIWKGRHYPS